MLAPAIAFPIPRMRQYAQDTIKIPTHVCPPIKILTDYRLIHYGRLKFNEYNVDMPICYLVEYHTEASTGMAFIQVDTLQGTLIAVMIPAIGNERNQLFYAAKNLVKTISGQYRGGLFIDSYWEASKFPRRINP